MSMSQVFLHVAACVLIYLNYFGTRVCRRNIWILYFTHVTHLLGSTTLVGCLKLYRRVSLLFFFFYQNTALSSRGEAGQQIYTRGLVIGGASIICPQISPTPLLIFTGVKKCDFWLITDQRSNLSCCGLDTEQDIIIVLKISV